MESKNLADSFSELNLTLSIILDDINYAIKKEMDKINASVIDQAEFYLGGYDHNYCRTFVSLLLDFL